MYLTHSSRRKPSQFFQSPASNKVSSYASKQFLLACLCLAVKGDQCQFILVLHIHSHSMSEWRTHRTEHMQNGDALQMAASTIHMYLWILLFLYGRPTEQVECLSSALQNHVPFIEQNVNDDTWRPPVTIISISPGSSVQKCNCIKLKYGCWVLAPFIVKLM